MQTEAGKRDVPGNTGSVEGGDRSFTEEAGWIEHCERQWLARLPHGLFFAGANPSHWQRRETLCIAPQAATEQQRKI